MDCYICLILRPRDCKAKLEITLKTVAPDVNVAQAPGIADQFGNLESARAARSVQAQRVQTVKRLRQCKEVPTRVHAVSGKMTNGHECARNSIGATVCLRAEPDTDG